MTVFPGFLYFDEVCPVSCGVADDKDYSTEHHRFITCNIHHDYKGGSLCERQMFWRKYITSMEAKVQMETLPW